MVEFSSSYITLYICVYVCVCVCVCVQTCHSLHGNNIFSSNQVSSIDLYISSATVDTWQWDLHLGDKC